MEAAIRLKQKWFRLRRGLRHLLGIERPSLHVNERVSEYRDRWRRAAESIGAELVPLTERVWEVRRDGRTTRISNHIVPLDDPVTLRLAGDKAYCYGAAGRAGVPVPEHGVFQLARLAEAKRFLRERRGPFVVKPARGTSAGMGVTTRIVSAKQLEEAALLAALFCEDFLVERMVAGETCRLLFLGDEYVHGVRRRGLRVTGDGRQPLRDLMRALGADPRDPMTSLFLEARRLAPDTVLPEGAVVAVSNVGAGETRDRELRTVYDEDITALVSPELVAELRLVAQAVSTEFAGIDFVTTDPALSLRRSGGAFLEINTTPGLHHHYVGPDDRSRSRAAEQVLEYLLGGAGTVPAAAGHAKETNA